ncbi:hypothetical protein [Streptomyces sp. NPDC101237]
MTGRREVCGDPIESGGGPGRPALAAFLASDAGVALTGTWVNATAGMFPS